MEQGAIGLDVRHRNSQSNGMVQGTIAVRWQQFSQSTFPNQGKLLEDELALTINFDTEVLISVDEDVLKLDGAITNKSGVSINFCDTDFALSIL